jgi:hypothetical protein
MLVEGLMPLVVGLMVEAELLHLLLHLLPHLLMRMLMN